MWVRVGAQLYHPLCEQVTQGEYVRHNLKLDTKWYDAVRDGRKKAEVRRADRPFTVGDELMLYTHDRSHALLADVTDILMIDEVPGCDCHGFASISIELRQEFADVESVEGALSVGDFG